jgi:hypothetical protein
MDRVYLPFGAPPSRRPAPGETKDDYRARLAADQYRERETRLQELAEQTSAHNSADVRIRAWEKTHGLRLPSKPNHPILQVIATATGLPLDTIEHEQQQRAQRKQEAEVASAARIAALQANAAPRE